MDSHTAGHIHIKGIVLCQQSEDILTLHISDIFCLSQVSAHLRAAQLTYDANIFTPSLIKLFTPTLFHPYSVLCERCRQSGFKK